MKKVFSIIIGCAATFTGFAQDTMSHVKSLDQQLPRFCLDLNYMEGALSQSPAMTDLSKVYTGLMTNAGNFSVKAPKFDGGHSRGGELTAGYFLGRARIFGIGLGVSYFSQTGNLNMDTFHVEYRRPTGNGSDVYRQVINSTGKITDKITASNLNIPLLLKFKHQLSPKVGVNVDLGGMMNVSTSYKYSTNAAFDYEAAYLRAGDGSYTFDATQGGFNVNDWLITKNNFNAHNATGNITQYFDQKFQNGYNVKLDTAVKAGTGSKFAQSVNFGFVGRVALSYKLDYHISVDLGGYYTYMMFKNTDNKMLTDKVGSYNSINSMVSSNPVSSYGINVGIRYYFGGFPDMDGDGVADSRDDCPKIPGLPEFNGCADSDHDGIPDKEDRCPYVYGSRDAFGCPDRDGDGVPDEMTIDGVAMKDQCPIEKGPWTTFGCPDRDGDGIPDKDDLCPDTAGVSMYNGCPSSTSKSNSVTSTTTTTTVVEPQVHHIVLSMNVINFKVGKADIADANFPGLDQVAAELKKDNKLIIFISGHTDDQGTDQKNMMLSFSRARSVEKYLIYRGVDKNRIVISGMGKTEPIIDNDSPENRAKNRRIEMRLLMPVSGR